MSDITAPDRVRLAPIALWRIAEAFLRFMFVLFGAPEEVAASHTLSRKRALQLRDWLAAGEAMLRRLLLIEAAAWTKRMRVSTPLPRKAAARVRRLMEFTADKPEAWRVRFQYFVAPAHMRAAAAPRLKSAPRRRPLKRFYSAWPLAERFEALRRVFNDPGAFARRLARRLRARPHRAAAVLHAAPCAAKLVGAAEINTLTDAAESAWCNSS